MKDAQRAWTVPAQPLKQLQDEWRIAEERVLGQGERVLKKPLASSSLEVAQRYVTNTYGPMWVRTIEGLYQASYAEGQVLVFRVLDPLLYPGERDPEPTALLVFAHPAEGGWAMGGGGWIGTVARMDRYAVACAWTWLRFWVPDERTIAALYCTVEDPRVAAIELETVEGLTMRAEVAGQRAVVFLYEWDARQRWPAQQPRAIRLFDQEGKPLGLPTSPVAGGLP